MAAPRILFFGYSEVGHDCLDLLLARRDHVVALITHEDKPAEKLWFRPPALLARSNGIPIHTPEKVSTPEWRETIAALIKTLSPSTEGTKEPGVFRRLFGG